MFILFEKSHITENIAGTVYIIHSETKQYVKGAVCKKFISNNHKMALICH